MGDGTIFLFQGKGVSIILERLKFVSELHASSEGPLDEFLCAVLLFFFCKSFVGMFWSFLNPSLEKEML